MSITNLPYDLRMRERVQELRGVRRKIDVLERELGL